MMRLCVSIVIVIMISTALSTHAAGADKDLRVQVVMPPGAEYVVIDAMDGVEARYRTMQYNDVYGEYSCAGYVKAYYEALYGVKVQNLTDAGPPYPEDLFTKVTTPQKGDIIFYPSPPRKNNHSAIVKSFDGDRITLIEQDYKWAQADGTYTYLNRTIPYPPDAANAYEIWRLVFAPDATEIPLGDDGADTAEDAGGIPSSDDEATPDVPLNDNGTDAANEPEAPTETNSTDDPLPVPPPEWPEQDETVPAFGTTSYEASVTIGRMAITVNGTDMPIDAPAMVQNQRTVMPVRWIAYALGLHEEDIIWDGGSRTVTVRNGDDLIMFTVDSYLLFVNYQPIVMDCPASVHSGRTYLPVRFLAEAMGVRVEWNNDTSTATFIK